MKAQRVSIPLGERKYDWLFLVFFVLNLGYITYMVDLEQLVIRDPEHFSYPLWPPAAVIDQVHWWGRNFDPLQHARPVWWKATIWIDALLFGPFYAVALYAFAKGRDFIRLPGVLWAAVMMTNVTIIMSEEIWGPHASPRLFIVALANAPWFLFPIGAIIRLWREHPFSRRTGAAPLPAGASTGTAKPDPEQAV
jgi:hypothetical protein